MDGTLAGRAALVVRVDENNGTEMDLGEIFTKILSSKLKLVVLEGRLLDNVELKPLMEGEPRPGSGCAITTTRAASARGSTSTTTPPCWPASAGSTRPPNHRLS